MGVQSNALFPESVSQRHDRLSQAAAKISPATCSGVGCADHLPVEHDGVPELIHDKGRAKAGHEEARDDQTCSTCHCCTGRYNDCSPAQQQAVSQTWAQILNHRTHDEACEDIERDCSNVCIADGCLACLLAH